MKNVVITLILVLFGVCLNAGEVEVNIQNVVAEWGGSISVGLYKQNAFPKEGQAIFSQLVPVRDIKARIIMVDVPGGEYAIAAYQDVNGDGELNRNIYGQPTEPYAFSNNVFGRFGPPKFAAVSFVVEKKGVSKLEIRLKD